MLVTDVAKRAKRMATDRALRVYADVFVIVTVATWFLYVDLDMDI